MTALVCGSYAYDTIMVFKDRFKNHILPDRVHMLNVAFLVPEMRREFGGCAGNVVHSLRMIGGNGVGMGAVGTDFTPYSVWMDAHGNPRDHLRMVPDTFTAQAYITTDLDDNQITAFHPGAMMHSHLNEVPVDAGITLGMVSPDGREGMVEHARQFAEAGIPFIFDPGQGLPMFDGAELIRFVELADWVVLNGYEAAMLVERTGLSPAKLAERCRAVVVTAGGEGSDIFTGGQVINIPVATPERVVDPTGCGDAYRAGLILGLMNDCDWKTTGRIASLMGAVKVAAHGTQNHRVTPEGFRDRFQHEFGCTPGI